MRFLTGWRTLFCFVKKNRRAILRGAAFGLLLFLIHRTYVLEDHIYEASERASAAADAAQSADDILRSQF